MIETIVEALRFMVFCMLVYGWFYIVSFPFRLISRVLTPSQPKIIIINNQKRSYKKHKNN